MQAKRFAFATSLRDELPSLALLAACYGAWALAMSGAAPLGLAVPLLALVLTLHSSLQHELLHGHPFRDTRLNAALAFPALGLCVPYLRFRDDHIAHHRDERLTDPYDDPETNYLDPAVWARLGPLPRLLMRANATLLGRMTLGPAIGLARFWAADARAIRRGEAAVIRAWALHAAGAAPVLACVWLSPVPPLAYGLAIYAAMGLLKVRTFLEHRADADPARRTAVVEDRGLLALLFLNNNFHAVHHASPKLPWHRLPGAYAARREAVLARNGGYRYGGYGAVFRRHLLRAKDPVAHPLYPGR